MGFFELAHDPLTLSGPMSSAHFNNEINSYSNEIIAEGEGKVSDNKRFPPIRFLLMVTPESPGRIVHQWNVKTHL
jgi:hypothetical protein